MGLSDATLARLEAHVADRGSLAKDGYLLEPRTRLQLEACLKCDRCGVKQGKVQAAIARDVEREKRRAEERAQSGSQPGTQKEASTNAAVNKAAGAGELTNGLRSVSLQPSEKEARPRLVCHYHWGRKVRVPGHRNKHFSCCNGMDKNDACVHESEHEFPRMGLSGLTANFQYYETPSGEPQNGKKTFVAIDCEMGQPLFGDSELIRLSMIDAANGEILIDQLVWPDVPMAHYNTQYSGVSKKDLEEARRMGECIPGRDAARSRVWKFVGPDTVVIGHGLRNDLACLRWIHHRVVDTLLIASARNKAYAAEQEAKAPAAPAAEAVAVIQDKGAAGALDGTANNGADRERPPKPKIHPSCALQALTKEILHRDIQLGPHDSVEDAQATLDLAVALVSMTDMYAKL